LVVARTSNRSTSGCFIAEQLGDEAVADTFNRIAFTD